MGIAGLDRSGQGDGKRALLEFQPENLLIHIETKGKA